jgi:hypothetical protein
MTFADLMVGDHFIWPLRQHDPSPDSVNVNLKIARSEDGGGFAIDLETRADCVDPTGEIPDEPKSWILGTTPVIKLNGRL